MLKNENFILFVLLFWEITWQLGSLQKPQYPWPPTCSLVLGLVFVEHHSFWFGSWKSVQAWNVFPEILNGKLQLAICPKPSSTTWQIGFDISVKQNIIERKLEFSNQLMDYYCTIGVLAIPLRGLELCLQDIKVVAWFIKYTNALILWKWRISTTSSLVTSINTIVHISRNSLKKWFFKTFSKSIAIRWKNCHWLKTFPFHIV